MVFLSAELVEALQKRQIDSYGGSYGLRDRGLLESAVARAENTAYYNPEVSVPEVGASLAWGLIKNHAFIDGNKRAGFVALQVFLELNGFRMDCTQQEETTAILSVAANEFTEEQWLAWCKKLLFKNRCRTISSAIEN